MQLSVQGTRRNSQRTEAPSAHSHAFAVCLSADLLAVAVLFVCWCSRACGLRARALHPHTGGPGGPADLWAAGLSGTQHSATPRHAPQVGATLETPDTARTWACRHARHALLCVVKESQLSAPLITRICLLNVRLSPTCDITPVIHARYPTKHFSLYFTHWDRWMGTLHPKYDSSLFRYFS